MNVSRRSFHQLLSKKMDRKKVDQWVAQLYKLLPGGNSFSINFEGTPPEVTLEFGDLPSVRRSALLGAFLKKYKGFSGGKPQETAIANFRKYEELCRSTNRKVRNMRLRVLNPYVDKIMFICQRKIANVLGPFNVEELLSSSRWGPGVTTSCKGSLVTSAQKFSSRPDVSPAFLSKARILMQAYPSWAALLSGSDIEDGHVCPILNIVPGNRIAFVPKTALTHRTIAVEPHVNVFFQNGLGRMIRRRLLRRGIDLSDQTTNQKLARLGSLDNSLATIDLEGASDTLSRELVRDLLPDDWFSWLDAARSHSGIFQGEIFRYEKFSSMGNGATFDLESLIFWAVSSAVVEDMGYNSFWVNVFGDDIIVPSGCYEKVSEVLTELGFVVNTKKSFSDGPFRESCGKDWYHGSNVRPVYLKDIPDTPLHWIRIANSLRLLSYEWGGRLFCDRSLLRAWQYAVSRVPDNLRKYKVPLELGADSGIISNLDEQNCARRCPRGWDGWIVPVIGRRPVTRLSKHRSLITAAVHTVSFDIERQPLRDRSLYREDVVFTPSWGDLGPWA